MPLSIFRGIFDTLSVEVDTHSSTTPWIVFALQDYVEGDVGALLLAVLSLNRIDAIESKGVRVLNRNKNEQYGNIRMHHSTLISKGTVAFKITCSNPFLIFPMNHRRKVEL